MNPPLNPKTRERFKRAGKISAAWATTLSMTLGSACAAWVAKDYLSQAAMKEQAVAADKRLGENDVARLEEIGRLSAANQRVVTALYERVAEKDAQLKEQALALSNMATALTNLAEDVQRLTKEKQHATSNIR